MKMIDLIQYGNNVQVSPHNINIKEIICSESYNNQFSQIISSLMKIKPAFTAWKDEYWEFFEFLKHMSFMPSESENKEVNKNNTIIKRFIKASFEFIYKWDKSNFSYISLCNSFLYFYSQGLNLQLKIKSNQGAKNYKNWLIVINCGSYKNISIILKILSEDIDPTYSK